MIGIHLSKALLTLGLLSSVALTDGAKVKRVKAGRVHAEHDSVHIVVNKVG